MSTKTNQKLWVIGDSFANLRHGKESWQLLLKDKFVGDSAIVSGRGGRDIQTIIDIFLKSLHLINDNDFVVLVLPTSARVRYPMKSSRLYLDYQPKGDIEILKNTISDEFTAYHANSTYHSDVKKELIYPLDIINDTMIEDLDEHDREKYYTQRDILNFFKKKSKLSYNQISTIINTSEAVLSNYNKQFYSFSKSFKFKTIFLSWSDDFNIFDKTNVITKSKLEDTLGKLQTQHELYIETNGEFGVYGDWHWSVFTDKKISEYIINNNSNYFVK
jgi:uncharacterized protein YfkK (UPF0435 family)